MIKKRKLIENLKNDTLCRVGCSGIHGVGVFAVRDIPRGIEVFKTCNNRHNNRIIELSRAEVEELGEPTTGLIKSYLAESHVGTFSLPESGMNILFWGYYVNHSNDPNLSLKPGEDPRDFVKFMTNRDIKEGEELTEDYNLLSFNKAALSDQWKFLARADALRA